LQFWKLRFLQAESVYIVLEYCSGGDLHDYLRTYGALSETKARAFARQLIQALDYLHANLVVHRDIKLENILLSEDGSIRLIGTVSPCFLR
jgi:serine/threonine protein kinase